jgi:hypothetical protein
VNRERIKAEEKGHKPLEGDIPASLPAFCATTGGGAEVRVAFGRLGDRGAQGRGQRARVAPDAGARGGVATYLHEIQSLGWQVAAKREARQGDLRLNADPATNRFWARLIPKNWCGRGPVFVSVAICDEGAVCD